ncbi:hypothetical protein EYF80_033154 [Liparis tanakae]|uniref:Uncharacterized protein n=1 Tax=Liparis tanakae TaxID=230148 RepID=A0A4Z2GSP4_9TELE|nr:hypothetical protein EYF80_033154 [Liparis tanakae]
MNRSSKRLPSLHVTDNLRLTDALTDPPLLLLLLTDPLLLTDAFTEPMLRLTDTFTDPLLRITDRSKVPLLLKNDRREEDFCFSRVHNLRHLIKRLLRIKLLTLS